MMGLYAALEVALRRAGEAVVIEWDGHSLRGVEVINGIQSAAEVLSASGIGFGDRVLIQVEKSLQSVFVYLAVLRLGAVFVPLNTGYRTK